ncbi:CapA family protein [Saccharicrinis fermentans]|uniref:Bacterial capsule synthesis protein PGA_cap n=1 Tax=Saccharicrinis fermentans DSM 9555 = JCM 21142 TaxID=869213 RepID=W7YDA1_9BACT|nr:CapA family protein [Saccharicrinis fermentans]GAF05473.1 bacterial capsule synthesis protein PGA_cap [Saccharicrinis fermentans DSM 9555 = JCM 21142]
MVKAKFLGIGILGAVFIACSCVADKSSTTITFVGDLLLDRGVRKRIERVGVDCLFKPCIDSIFSNSDFVVANLECPVTKIHQPIYKKYIFRGEPEWLKKIKEHGITHLNMANNHAMDQGRRGIVDTKRSIIANGMVAVGAGENASSACKPVMICENPRKVYLISSLLVPSENWTYMQDKPCVCEASISEIAQEIINLKTKEKTALVLVQLHWGAENTLKPIVSQKQQAYQLINAGADMIIGHHSHTIQTIEYYDNKPIFYSIGNFIFDANKAKNKNGILVQIKVTKNEFCVDYKRFEIEKCSPEIVK